MVNLTILKLRAFGGHPASEILTGCTFQLKGLFWGSHSDKNGLSNFLPHQRDLEGLNVAWDQVDPTFLSATKGASREPRCFGNVSPQSTGNFSGLDSPARGLTQPFCRAPFL